MSTDSPDDLVMLVSAGSSFEAHILVAVLKNVGIEAVALDAAQTTLSMLDVKYNRVPIQVRRCDLERAAEALKTNIEDSIDIDWDEIDIGQREDELPLRTPGWMPPAARIAFIVALIVLLVTLAGTVVRFVW